MFIKLGFKIEGSKLLNFKIKINVPFNLKEEEEEENTQIIILKLIKYYWTT